MEPTDMTVRILQEIRDGQKAQTLETQGIRDELRQGREHADLRFEVIETTLRDLAQQMVMMTRAVKVALDSRSTNEGRLDDHEKRLQALENSH